MFKSISRSGARRFMFVLPIALTIASLISGTADAAGRVSTTRNGDHLYISGDGADNSIRIYRDATNQLLVLGVDGTRVGNFRGRGFNNIDEIVVFMDQGADVVRVEANLKSVHLMCETVFLTGADIQEDAELYCDAASIADCQIGDDLLIHSANAYTGYGDLWDFSIWVDIDATQVSGDTRIKGTNGYDYLAIEGSTFGYFYADLKDEADTVKLTAMSDDLVFGKLMLLLGAGYDSIDYAAASFQGVVPTHEIISIDTNSYVYGGMYWETSAAQIEFDNFYSWTADFGVPNLGTFVGVDTGAITPTGRPSSSTRSRMQQTRSGF